MIRAAALEIGKAEVVMMDPRSPKWRKSVEVTADAAEKGKAWCGEAVAILNDVKRKAEGYLRGL